MYIEIKRVYPFATFTATFTDPERGWESDSPVFLSLIDSHLKMTQSKRFGYYPNRLQHTVEVLAESLKAEIVRMQFGFDMATADTNIPVPQFM